MIAIDKWQTNNQACSSFKAAGPVWDHDGTRFNYLEHQRFDGSKGAWTHEEIRFSN